MRQGFSLLLCRTNGRIVDRIRRSNRIRIRIRIPAGAEKKAAIGSRPARPRVVVAVSTRVRNR